ncbi:MAG: phenylacetate--CoA ligase family protein [Steroidobacteraceae bacterium]
MIANDEVTSRFCPDKLRNMSTSANRIPVQSPSLASPGWNWRRPLIRAALRFQHAQTLPEVDLISAIERSPGKIEAVQKQRLEQLLRHAWAETDYYREVLERCGAVIEGRVNLERFADIPFLTKKIIREQGERLRAKGLPGGRRAFANRSSGTSGEPVHFWQDNVYWDVTIATRIYHFSMAGKTIGEREMKIWGSERDLYQGTIGLKAKLQNWIYNRRFEQCFYLPEQSMRRIITHINDWKPKMLWCYRDGIYALAQYINQHGIFVHTPASVVLGGATVYPFMAETIERAFGAPVISAYGSREIGAAACECGTGEGHHLATQSHVVEAIDPDEQPVMEKDGELAITPLMNWAMPLIRYRIGDRGRLTSRRCSCGRAFPLLDALTGRVFEAMTNSKGEHVDGGFVVYVLAFMAERGYIRKFQVIQEEDGSITINVVPETATSLKEHVNDVQLLTEKIQVVMGQDCPVRFVEVDDIPLNPSGKYPYVICRRPAVSTSTRGAY